MSEQAPPRRPTIGSIAKAAGVSTAAVSYALNGLPGVSPDTRERILVVADEIGWRPNRAARSLSVSRAYAVGLVLARSARTLGVQPFFMRFISGLEQELAARRYALLLQVVEDHRTAIEALRTAWAERRVDGVIVTDVWDDDPRLPVLTDLGVPAVIVGRPQPDSPYAAVWSDDAAAVHASVDHLVEQGHRRIARVAGFPSLEHTRVRTAAFREAVARHGLPTPTVIATDYTAEEGAAATRRLLGSARPPTAITFDNDVMAVAALGVARELGVGVPEQLSLVAGDDSQLCTLVHPSLTALSRDVAQYGAHAARTLLDAVDGKDPVSFEDSTATLTVRGSTGPA